MSICPVALLTNLRKDIADVYPHLRWDLLPTPAQASSAGEAAAIAQLTSTMKKFEPEGISDEAAKAATDLFIQMNDRCAQWTRPSNPLHNQVLCEMAKIANSELPKLSWMRIFASGRHGPGASAGSRERNSAFEKLFLNRVSTTSLALYQTYRRLQRCFPLLDAAEEIRRNRYKKRNGSTLLVRGSVLSVAPKYSHIGRIICVQPSLNMYMQLGYGEVLNECLAKSYGYSPALQPDRNRRLAWRGSVDGTIATIDSTSASDTIAVSYVLGTMRSDHAAVIQDLRSEEVRIDGEWIKLNMVSEQGNGFTFPLQTYLFSLMVKAYCRTIDFKWERYDVPGTRFGVFGDDIIVPAELAVGIMELMESLGFIPNKLKSFYDGPFRESCGSDWYSGTFIRPVYVRKLTSTQDVYSVINRLNRWSALHLVPLKRTIRGLLTPGWRDFRIPPDESLDAGVMVPQRGVNPGNTIYNAYAVIDVNDDVYVHTKKWRYAALKGRYNNPIGLMYSTISGHVRDGCISRRQRDLTYCQEERSTPCWQCVSDFRGDGNWFSNWLWMAEINLYGTVAVVDP